MPKSNLSSNNGHINLFTAGQKKGCVHIDTCVGSEPSLVHRVYSLIKHIHGRNAYATGRTYYQGSNSDCLENLLLPCLVQLIEFACRIGTS